MPVLCIRGFHTETHPKKLEFNIDKSETGLKKIDININVNDDQLDDMNDEETAHLSGDLTDDEYSNSEDHKHPKKQRNYSISR